ncbi:Protein maternal effect lethal 26 [Frankliniella fusca]|uniref:Protein maternal effect lethal 26 n=1 Tax=Frankliniella fusca TaxID=407009 RepID=A0AAE1H422_9NEOP|nr:Protein maternal effect lethal 26 [Frankliniella fusca]
MGVGMHLAPPLQSKMQKHTDVYHNDAASEGHQGDDLISDLARLLEQGMLSDVVLQAQGNQQGGVSGDKASRVELRAHKAVLVARSPVFQRLLMSDMVESRTSTVAVDFPAHIMELVLRYAYAGSVDLGAEDAKGGGGKQSREAEAVTAMALLAAADYYQMSGLKRQCEGRLLQRVGLVPEEVLQTMLLADRYGARALKEAALDVAADHLKPLRQLPEWADFARHNHELVVELMGVLVDKLVKARQAMTVQAVKLEKVQQAAAVQADKLEKAQQAMTVQADKLEKAQQTVAVQADKLEKAQQAMTVQADKLEKAQQAMTVQADKPEQARQVVDELKTLQVLLAGIKNLRQAIQLIQTSA